MRWRVWGGLNHIEGTWQRWSHEPPCFISTTSYKLWSNKGDEGQWYIFNTQSVKQHFKGVPNYVEISRLQILHLPLPFAHLIWFCVLCRVSSPRWGVGWLDLPLFARSWDRRGGGGKKALWLALPGLVTRQDGEGGGGDGVVAIASQEFSSFCIYPC